MTGGRRGASQSVLRAIGLDNTAAASGVGAMSRETAKCPLCGSLLEFGTDVLIGQAYERCTGGRSCPNARPHPPRPAPDALDSVRGPYRRKRSGHVPLAVVAGLLVVALVVFVAGIVAGLALGFIGVVRVIGGVEEG